MLSDISSTKYNILNSENLNIWNPGKIIVCGDNCTIIGYLFIFRSTIKLILFASKGIA